MSKLENLALSLTEKFLGGGDAESVSNVAEVFESLAEGGTDGRSLEEYFLLMENVLMDQMGPIREHLNLNDRVLALLNIRDLIKAFENPYLNEPDLADLRAALSYLKAKVDLQKSLMEISTRPDSMREVDVLYSIESKTGRHVAWSLSTQAAKFGLTVQEMARRDLKVAEECLWDVEAKIQFQTDRHGRAYARQLAMAFLKFDVLHKINLKKMKHKIKVFAPELLKSENCSSGQAYQFSLSKLLTNIIWIHCREPMRETTICHNLYASDSIAKELSRDFEELEAIAGEGIA